MSTSMHTVPFAKLLVPKATECATGHSTCFKRLLHNITHVIYININITITHVIYINICPQSAFKLSNWLSYGMKNKFRVIIPVGENTVRGKYILPGDNFDCIKSKALVYVST